MSDELEPAEESLDVLPIDEFGYLYLKPEQSNIFFKLMEERYHRRSTILTTNLEHDEWHNFLGNKPMAEALLSRLRVRQSKPAGSCGARELRPPPANS